MTKKSHNFTTYDFQLSHLDYTSYDIGSYHLLKDPNYPSFYEVTYGSRQRRKGLINIYVSDSKWKVNGTSIFRRPNQEFNGKTAYLKRLSSLTNWESPTAGASFSRPCMGYGRYLLIRVHEVVTV